jgi:hypothetical protein
MEYRDYKGSANVEVARAQKKDVPEYSIFTWTTFGGIIGGAIGGTVGAVYGSIKVIVAPIVERKFVNPITTVKGCVSDWYYAGVEEGACCSEGKWRDISDLGLWYEETDDTKNKSEEETKKETNKRPLFDYEVLNKAKI